MFTTEESQVKIRLSGEPYGPHASRVSMVRGALVWTVQPRQLTHVFVIHRSMSTGMGRDIS
ncbi:MAG: hypothetical protein WAO89_07050, partial [Kiritimatiellia bacterium]